MLRRSFSTTANVARDAYGRLRHPRREMKEPTVVMFHGVSECASRDWGPWQYTVTPDQLDERLARLCKHHKIVSLDELSAWLAGRGSIPEDALVVTFDDGYRDFLTEAVPILERYKVPATVYVSTSLLGADPPFEQRLGEALLAMDTIDVTFDGSRIDRSLDSLDDVVSVYEMLRGATKYARTEHREALLSRLDTSGASTEEMLTPTAVSDLADHPLVTVGSHGHEHVPFGMLSGDEIAENVETSVERLASLLGRRPRHFSFPYGSHDRAAIRTVHSRGFESVATTEPRPVRPRDWDRRTLPRYDGAVP
ncbi:polysaccharide deacetylase family protein [Halorussus salinisoli]|uniref:polysaccharide deacetylase family protein n=1 Tax=Halorussus salinisoli TaxID=2558242 RepID=UPI0010C1EF30|nr:polysaccharide deacetylase family protein [Halorussus salinisoli]